MPSNVGLKHALIKKVFRGNATPFNNIVSVATGEGTIGDTTTKKIGMFCMDRSSGSFYICTATTGTGTWVAINA
jgi:hypothetical protein